jgi:ABC-type branched-subunit amino acid transport system substrate-binding protein
MTPGELVTKWRGEAVAADNVQTAQTTDTARMAAKAIAQCKRQDADELEAALAQGGGA